ncbi:class I SAM-dependent methyltransferase [Tuwongella immobilis]|uniref:class I SAM-dependent methyltransferase n=1 Tax=Tuwongella immobilis TaxID=692036 RepID=UPI0013A700C1|nr:class I SAM-dependent methyltransferase [Tuwongella immobilis]
MVRCDDCGLLFTNPRPAPESMGAFYSENYQPHRRGSKLRRPLRKWYPLARLNGRAMERKSLPHHGKGRLLDFGCGGGSFLERMAEQGWEVTGLDTSMSVVERIRSQLKLSAVSGTLPHPELKPETFDVVTMWHSLEHVHDPLAVLREAYRLLVPGGRLLVATPNIESWPHRWFGTNWFGLDLPRHLTHFTPTTLRRMIETAGFECGLPRMIRHADWLRSSARLAMRRGDARWTTRLLTRKPIARLAAWGCFVAGQSDCMFADAARPLTSAS